ncbi:hypothetical protein KHA80_20640 [Anaerobacillus sp. HL2]|nr:hypothetical protein KHA80_20640 [Anaerobacillus sp. HL2]
MEYKKVTFLTPIITRVGNATTARRIVAGLIEFNIDTNVVAYNEQPLTADWLEWIEKSSLLHILHFRRFAEWWIINFFRQALLLLGGTDVTFIF